MAKQQKVVLKVRTKIDGSPTPWEIVEDMTRLGEAAVDRAVAECDRLQKSAGSDAEHGVFVGSALVHWMTAKGPKKSKSSVRAEPAQAAGEEVSEHRHYTFKDPDDRVVAEIVARDQDTALRILDQHAFEWDLTKVKIVEGELVTKGKFNRIVYLHQTVGVTDTGGQA
jgi:hypothetical protein